MHHIEDTEQILPGSGLPAGTPANLLIVRVRLDRGERPAEPQPRRLRPTGILPRKEEAALPLLPKGTSPRAAISMDRMAVQRWLDAYVQAWMSYDPDAIGALFSEDAVYYYHPYDEPVRDREAIVASWVEPEQRDAPGTYSAHYEPVAVEGDVAVTNGRSRYFEADGMTLRTEFDNIFVLRFDEAGRCREFREWYVERR